MRHSCDALGRAGAHLTVPLRPLKEELIKALVVDLCDLRLAVRGSRFVFYIGLILSRDLTCLYST